MKAFDDAGVADSPSYRKFQKQGIAVFVLLLAYSVWRFTAATDGFYQVIAVVLGIFAIGGLLMAYDVSRRARARRRSPSAGSPKSN
jgi:hypothetical protein